MFKVEIVTVRDPDAANDYAVFVNGKQVDMTSPHPSITIGFTDIDPGASGVTEEWVGNMLSVDLSDEARQYVRSVVADYADREDIAMPAEQTWTFFGHWQDGRIVVEYTAPGEVQDDREDTGQYPEGLWAAAGTGVDEKTVQAAVIAEYETPTLRTCHREGPHESHDWPDIHKGGTYRCETIQDTP